MLNFTLKQLRYVTAAGREGSIANAANSLNISQSSITAAIDALEAGLGYDLFLRSPAKGIDPTSAGLQTLKLIRSYLEQTLHFEADLMSVGGAETGEADLVFTYERSVDRWHEFHPLFAAPPYALIATSDPLSKQSEVTLAQ